MPVIVPAARLPADLIEREPRDLLRRLAEGGADLDQAEIDDAAALPPIRWNNLFHLNFPTGEGGIAK